MRPPPRPCGDGAAAPRRRVEAADRERHAADPPRSLRHRIWGESDRQAAAPSGCSGDAAEDEHDMDRPSCSSPDAAADSPEDRLSILMDMDMPSSPPTSCAISFGSESEDSEPSVEVLLPPGSSRLPWPMHVRRILMNTSCCAVLFRRRGRLFRFKSRSSPARLLDSCRVPPPLNIVSKLLELGFRATLVSDNFEPGAF